MSENITGREGAILRPYYFLGASFPTLVLRITLPFLLFSHGGQGGQDKETVENVSCLKKLP